MFTDTAHCPEGQWAAAIFRMNYRLAYQSGEAALAPSERGLAKIYLIFDWGSVLS